VEDGLQAKFSIPYTVAYTLLYGVPSAPSCFSAVDEAARALAREHVGVRVDDALPETGALLELGGEPVAKVGTATGSPSRPMTDAQLAAKVSMLGAGHLRSMLESPDAPARDLAAAALEGLGGPQLVS
jgi:2-methylcitrate dehydratase PrpD